MTAAPVVYKTAATKYLIPQAIAQLFAVSPMTVYRMIHEGHFPNAITVGRSYRVPVADIRAYELRNRLGDGNMGEGQQ